MLEHRCEQANKALEAISLKGRQLFYSHTYERTAHFYVDRIGICWYVDHATGMKMAPMIDLPKWVGFSYGETARELVLALTEYIGHGMLVPMAQFQKEWGYPAADMEAVRKEVIQLGIVGG